MSQLHSGTTVTATPRAPLSVEQRREMKTRAREARVHALDRKKEKAHRDARLAEMDREDQTKMFFREVCD